MSSTVVLAHVAPALKHVELLIGGRAAFNGAVTTPSFKCWPSTDSSIAVQFGAHVVDSLLSLSSLEPHTVELLTPERYIDSRAYIGAEIGTGQIVRRTLAIEYVRERVAQGATLVINGADRFDAVIMSNREYLEYLVGTICWCNVYFSQTARSPFGRHSDSHDVLVVQGAGEKRWAVYEPTTGNAVFDGVIATGDVLFVPQGWEHEVAGTGRPSTHWTFGFNRAASKWTALSIISSKVRGGHYDTFNMAEFAQSVKNDVSELLSADESSAAARVFTERRAGGSFAFTGADVPLERVMIRMAPRIPPVILPGADDDTFRLLAAGKLFRIGGRLKPAFELLLLGEQIAASALAAQCGVEDPRRLIEWGIANGLVIASVMP
jgi:hypothetical protein